MKRIEPRVVLMAVAVIETLYAIAGLLTPPSMMTSVTGWVLSPDGQWVAKLLGAALASQAWVAWIMRNDPHVAIVRALAFYQIVAATVDWVMWLAMADQGIFSTPLSRISVAGSVFLHYTLGFLLLVAIRNVAVKDAKSPSSPTFVPARRYAGE